MSKRKRKPETSARRVYVLYDERAWYDVDEASVLMAAETLEEVKVGRSLFPNSVLYSYKEMYSKKDKKTLLVEERLEE